MTQSNEDELRQGTQESVTGPALSAASSRGRPNGGDHRSETSRVQRAALSRGFSIRDLMREAYDCADEKGFHDTPPSIGEDVALFHSECSEVLEAWRDFGDLDARTEASGKPYGVPSELADIVIRVAHFAAKHSIDLEDAVRRKAAFNRTRPHRHGGKKL